MLSHEKDVRCGDEGAACMDLAEGGSNLKPNADVVELSKAILHARLLDSKIT